MAELSAELPVSPGGSVPPLVEIIHFAAACGPCAWHGPERRSNLTALNDYDRHALTARHALAVLTATAAPDAGDEEDTDV